MVLRMTGAGGLAALMRPGRGDRRGEVDWLLRPPPETERIEAPERPPAPGPP